jgi:GLPGLI family protein
MKFIYASLFFLCYFSSLTGQDFQVVYEKTTHTPMSELYDFYPLEMYSMVSRYTLTFSEGVSRLTLDSVKLSGDVQNFGGWATVIANDFIKDWPNNLLYYRRGDMYDGYATRSKIDIENANAAGFEIVPEFREILGIKCQKMKNIDGYELWFTSSIPYADGPFSYPSPTPGLVLLCRDESYEYRAISLKLGDYSINIPDYKYVEEIEEVTFTINEQKKLGKNSDQIIFIDHTTPADTWLKLNY